MCRRASNTTSVKMEIINRNALILIPVCDLNFRKIQNAPLEKMLLILRNVNQSFSDKANLNSRITSNIIEGRLETII